MADVRTWYQDGQCVLLQAHVLDALATLPAESVHCCVTSPPYWGQRVYRDDQAVTWGGDPECEHDWVHGVKKRSAGGERGYGSSDGFVGRAPAPVMPRYATCLRCGAWHGALGHEPTPDMFVAHLVEVFAAVRRVLHPTGTLWVNLDDTRASSPGGYYECGDFDRPSRQAQRGSRQRRSVNGLKPLDLCAVPERFVLAMQADGWWYRGRIAWWKRSCMVESVKGVRWERHRVKVGGGDNERVREVSGIQTHGETISDGDHRTQWADCPGCPKCEPNGGFVLRRGAWRPTEDWEFVFMFTRSDRYYCDGYAVQEPTVDGDGFRNLRSFWVWDIPSEPSKLPHRAAFPSELPRRCILASTSERGVCPSCLAPWARVVEHKNMVINRSSWGEKAGNRTAPSGTMVEMAETRTLGWRATCKCGREDVIPAVVLDCFSGKGTTLWAAKQLGRKSIGVDISPEYCRMTVDQTDLRQLAMMEAI